MGWAQRANSRAQVKRLSEPAPPPPIKPVSLQRRHNPVDMHNLHPIGVLAAAAGMIRRAGKARAARSEQ